MHTPVKFKITLGHLFSNFLKKLDRPPVFALFPRAWKAKLAGQDEIPDSNPLLLVWSFLFSLCEVSV